MGFSALEHRINRRFPLQARQSRLLVAVSGGADSVALLRMLVKLRRLLKLDLGVAHFHHGGLAVHRTVAQEFVKSLAVKLDLPFYLGREPDPDQSTIRGKSRDESEAGLRKARYEYLRRIRTNKGYDWIVLGHHADDLLETRLLRLIRGSGPQGLMAMKELKGDLCRPFLSLTKKEILNYLAQGNYSFLQDPSNLDSRYLRNFIREKWLPLLDQQRPGAVGRLGRSLELMAEGWTSGPSSFGAGKTTKGDNGKLAGASEDLAEKIDLRSDPRALDSGLGFCSLNRRIFNSFSPPVQRQFIGATYLRLVGSGYSERQILEVQRRLQTSRKVFDFTVGKLIWMVTGEGLVARPAVIQSEEA